MPPPRNGLHWEKRTFVTGVKNRGNFSEEHNIDLLPYAYRIENAITDGFNFAYNKIANAVDDLSSLLEKAFAAVVNAFDPNSMVGPSGFGSGNFISRPRRRRCPYQINFENSSCCHGARPSRSPLPSSSIRISTGPPSNSRASASATTLSTSPPARSTLKRPFPSRLTALRLMSKSRPGFTPTPARSMPRSKALIPAPSFRPRIR